MVVVEVGTGGIGIEFRHTMGISDGGAGFRTAAGEAGLSAVQGAVA